MEYSVVMAGFGGQGILLMGDLLAFSSMKAGFNVTWMPAYGAEMRGGYANCTVIVSEEQIGAPIVSSPNALIALSGPAVEKFLPGIQPGGLLVANSSLVNGEAVQREDIQAVFVPARELAEASGDLKMSNLVMLGAFLAVSKLIKVRQVAQALPSFLSGGKEQLAPAFEKALNEGERFIRSLPVVKGGSFSIFAAPR